MNLLRTLSLLWVLLDHVSVGVTGLKYVWGDAFDDQDVMGPDGNPYPWNKAARIATKQRSPRSFSDDSNKLLSPKETRDILLKAFQAQERGDFLPGTSFIPQTHEQPSHLRSPGHHNNHNNLMSPSGPKKGTSERENNPKNNGGTGHRQGRGNDFLNQSNFNDNSDSKTFNSPGPGPGPGLGPVRQGGQQPADREPDGCVPPRLCASTYNTTAPLYGVSLTSGQPVTIVQKFPDLLQQVVFQVCKTSECEVIHGECVQTYLPYLFLVIPLGPVTLTGQDYVLVESGCVCRPKFARKHDEPPPLPFIQPLQN